jgi:diguanylate cyclase (GGDEF)-like protein
MNVVIWQYQLFMVLMPFAGAAILLCIITSWKWRFLPKGRTFLISQCCALGFLIFNTLELVSANPQTTIFFMKISFVFLALIPPFWLLFALHYIGRTPRKTSWLFFIIPAITIALIWTNESLHWFWTDYQFIPVNEMLAIKTRHGFWFIPHALYSHTLLITGSIMLFIYFADLPKVYRRQAALLFTGIAFPILYNLIAILKLVPIQKDFTGIAMAVPAMAFSYSIAHYHLFDLTPVSRSSLLECLPDGVIVIDTLGRVIDINRTAKLLLKLDEDNPIGATLEDLFADWKDLRDNEKGMKLHKYKLEMNGEQHKFSLSISNQQDGKILIFRDVTDAENLLNEVQALTALDPLTGLINRRHFFELAEKNFEQAARYRRLLSVILLDIDHFKQINDLHGHQKSDEVLCTLTRFCQEHLRKADLLARYGGDELIFLLPETDLKQAHALAERLRQGSHELSFTGKKEPFQITISIGICCSTHPYPVLSLEDLIERADQALYQAKRDGRNKVVRWGD